MLQNWNTTVFRRLARIGQWMFVLVLLLNIVSAPAGSADASTPPEDTAANLQDARYVQLVVGAAHTCGLTPGGAVHCWGSNWAGQLGDGTYFSFGVPGYVNGLSSGVTSLTAGVNFTCALLETGTVNCWGGNEAGQLGDGTTDTAKEPVDVSGLSDVVAIGAGGSHACAVTTGGDVWCWGSNWAGQLGDNSTDDSHTPVAVAGLAEGARAVEAGMAHTCALLETGTVKCWGGNEAGQLGDGSNTSSLAPVTVSELAGVTQISTAREHTCALLENGSIACWGRNWGGMLGDGTRDDRNAPVDVVGLSSPATHVMAGGGFSCALVADGYVQCWGANELGQLGDGTFADSMSPVTVANTTGDMVALGGEYSHACASAPAVTICWGANWDGALGDGVGMTFSAPREVVDLENNIEMLSAGSNTCALDDSGSVQCWGVSWAGQLGNGTWDRASRPTPVSGLDGNVKAISQFGETICALTVSNGVKCWGLNDRGQVGDGTIQDFLGALTPTDVVGLQSGVAAVTSGRYHNCAVLDDGTVRCWGANDQGQLGDGTTEDSSTPVAVQGLTSATALTAGSDHTCALLEDTTVRCWGGNGDGQLGNGTFDASLTPVPVKGLTNVVAMESSLWNTCAITGAGAVKCWGSSHTGQLGRGGYDPSNEPVDVTGMDSGVTSISGGNDHFCAVKDGGAWCWGNNDRAQSGSGQTDEHLLVPVPVIGMSANVSSITAGSDHTCAIAAGRAKCWGNNAGDGLGLGRKLLFEEPVTVLLERPRAVDLSYNSGAPGSFFTVRGSGFAPDQNVVVDVSSQPAQNMAAATSTVSQQMTIATDAFGEFILFVDTRGAAPGSYRVQASSGSKQVSSVVALASTAPVQKQEGGGAVLSLFEFIYLPAVVR